MEVMDEWVAEFLLRRQRNPRVSSANLISALNLGDSPDCLKLKISSVLRDLSNCLVRGTLDEGMLDLLETLKNLLQFEADSVLMESHKSAYCWMAVECTVGFMWPLSVSEGLFTDAVERIWIKRIGILKEKGSALVTDELLKWESDLKQALEDPEVYQRIRETNVRYTAISFLSQLLKEQWEVLGSSSLELLACRSLLKRKARNVDDRGDPSPVFDEGTRHLVDNANERCGEEENGNGNNRENGNDVEGVGCLENDETNTADEEQAMGAQEQEHRTSFDEGNKTAAREMKDLSLEIQGLIDPSTRQGQEPDINHSVDVTPHPSGGHGTRRSGQYRNEASQQDYANVKGSDSPGTLSGRIRPRLLTPVPRNVSPLDLRRSNKLWTPEEVEALREGVKEYGKSWKDIKNANPAVFRERTEVDLKDKWRNLFGR